MERIRVESSVLQEVGYDAARRLLEIQFLSGRVYRYFDVAPDVHQKLMAADSLGSYFNDAIRDCYQYAQVRRGR